MAIFRALFVPIHFVAFVACDRNTEMQGLMDAAEKVVSSNADSALRILDSIPASKIRGKEARARYALLKSIVLDKNYIDKTTFEVLQPAIDYYPENGSCDEKLRTYYYQGRIFQNKGDEDAAIRCFLNGSDLRNGVTDTLLLAHTWHIP